MILPASPPRRDVLALAFLLCCCFLLVPLFLPLLCCCCCSYRRVCAGLLARRRGQPVSLPALPGRPGQRAVTGPQLSCASCLLAWCVRACVCVRVSFGFPPFLGPGAWASCRVVIVCKVASLGRLMASGPRPAIEQRIAAEPVDGGACHYGWWV